MDELFSLHLLSNIPLNLYYVPGTILGQRVREAVDYCKEMAFRLDFWIQILTPQLIRCIVMFLASSLQ